MTITELKQTAVEVRKGIVTFFYLYFFLSVNTGSP